MGFLKPSEVEWGEPPKKPWVGSRSNTAPGGWKDTI